MATVNVRLFGRLSIQVDQRPVEGLEAGKAQELLCYLLLYRDRPHRREGLASLLWGDSSGAQARKYLRQALWQLQSALDSRDEADPARLLVVESDWVRVNPVADLWADATLFDLAIEAVGGVPGRALDEESARTLAAAADLYAGDLLEGWYQDWCLFERERLQARYLGLLDKLIAHCLAGGRYEAGVGYATRALRHDRARERTHRQLMRLHDLAGDRTAALRQYRACAAVLDQELGVRPSRRTTALYEQIRADLGEALPFVSAPEAAGPAGSAAPLPRVLGHLRQLRATLLDIEEQVERDIAGARVALDEPAGR
jgi:DNA-binding SARP family transcriptional activator